MFEGIGKWFDKNGDSIYGTKAGGVSMGKQVVSTRKGDTLYIHFLDPTVKAFTFLLDGKKTTVKCERPCGDVSDIVVRFPLCGKTPTQYIEPGSHDAESRKTREVKFAKPVKARYFRFVATHALPVNDRLAVAEVDVW